ncbi:MAG: hypothetical protein PHX43_06610 [Alphaproteobacteria bacterium]|nr:hypothetical protein [Alphaproteobacteria bacterium]
MSDDVNDLDMDAEASPSQNKKKGGDKAGTGAVRQHAAVSEAARELMQTRGFSIQQITQILKDWRHLDAKEVAIRLAEFSTDMAKASAHIVVSFTQDAGHALVHNFLKHCRHVETLVKKMTPESRQRLQSESAKLKMG